MIARVQILGGKKMRFDDEAKALYDADPPKYPESHFTRIVEQLSAELPGEGSVLQRHVAFRNRFIIPGDKLDAVFSTAITEARKRRQ